MSKVAQLQYQTSVEELYDVKILEGMKRPNVLSTMKDDFRKALVHTGRPDFLGKGESHG